MGKSREHGFAMSAAPSVEAVVRSAARRSILVLFLENAALPCAAVLAVLALLLVFGTDILRWYWPALLGAAAVVFVALKIRRGILPRYRVAQLIDRRLGLNDSLATAWYLLSKHSRISGSAAAQFQIQQAERIAASIEAAAALPFARQRAWVATACLAALVLGLFIVRASKIETLSLRAPLIPVQAAMVVDVENFLSSRLDPLPLWRRFHGTHAAGEHAQTTRGEAPPGEPGLGSSGQNRAENSAGQDQNSRRAQRSERSSNNSTRNSTREASSGKPDANGNNGKQGADKSEQRSSPSLLARMKDALSSLMADMRSSAQGKRSQDTSAQPANSAANHDLNSSANRRAGEQPGSNAQAQLQAAQKQGASLGRSQSAAKHGSNAQSGIGSQNGDKQLRQAEELAAMGKLAKILGKRSADLTGDMTVQALPGTTELQTPDTQRVGQHADLGGEIHRNEVPLIYRDYVQRYMEEVHKDANQNPPAR